MIEPTPHFLASLRSTPTEELHELVGKWGSRTTAKLWTLGDEAYILALVRELRQRSEKPRITVDELRRRLK